MTTRNLGSEMPRTSHPEEDNRIKTIIEQQKFFPKLHIALQLGLCKKNPGWIQDLLPKRLGLQSSNLNLLQCSNLYIWALICDHRDINGRFVMQKSKERKHGHN
uniref:Uncharacterized protein n=1 Tax=Romanomermis culicivorax TaxID=13658 RepID=A0A915KHS2_ROMCU